MIGALSPDMSLSTDTCACKRLEKKGLQPAQMTSPSLPGILQGKSSWVPFHAILCSTCQVTSRLIYFDPTQSRDLESALRRRCNHGGSVLTLHAPPLFVATHSTFAAVRWLMQMFPCHPDDFLLYKSSVFN